MYLEEDIKIEEKTIKIYLEEVWWDIVCLWKTILGKSWRYKEKPYYCRELDTPIIKLLKRNLPRYKNGYFDWVTYEERQNKLKLTTEACNRLDWDRYRRPNMSKEDIQKGLDKQKEDQQIVMDLLGKHLFQLWD